MPLSKSRVRFFVKEALREDMAVRDITTLAFIAKGVHAEARIIAKEDGVVCGTEIAREVFKIFDRSIAVGILKKDGKFIKNGDTILELKGRACSLLSCERTALNFLSVLSGISTMTYRAARQVKAEGVTILDTRKTTPLWRAFEKYAVLMGGGKNHRFDLSDRYLVKDNHAVVIRQTTGFPVLMRRKKGVLLEIEVDDLDSLKEVLQYKPDIVMLDNFTLHAVREAVAFLQSNFPSKNNRPKIELSGGVTLENVSRYAIKGVDFISLGALTHSAPALDFSLEITKVY